MFHKFGCRNLEDYYNLYITTDLLLLADIFQVFGDTCINHYGLGPTHLFTSPRVAWQSALQMTDIESELMA